MPRPRLTPRQRAARKKEARARSKRWYRANREEAKKKSLERWHAKPNASRAAKPHEWRFAKQIGGWICGKRELERPQLKFIDAGGRVHVEEFLTAEELIRAWQRTQRGGPRKEKNKKCGPEP